MFLCIISADGFLTAEETAAFPNKKKAIEFIDEQINIIDSTKVATYCKDALINAIIYYYKELCDKNNINLKIRIKNIDKQLKISTSEVAIVLANCLENAFNAVNKLKENTKLLSKPNSTENICKIILNV